MQWKKYVNKIALIWSKHDNATATAIWAPLAGGRKGHRRVKNKPGNYPGIERFTYHSKSGIAFTKPQQILLIDASEVIFRDAHFKSGKAHSDIYNPEVAKLLWQLIESSTY